MIAILILKNDTALGIAFLSFSSLGNKKSKSADSLFLTLPQPERAATAIIRLKMTARPFLRNVIFLLIISPFLKPVRKNTIEYFTII